MISRHEAAPSKQDIWSGIAAPVPADQIEWRQDGKVIARDGRYFARFVGYISAGFVRQRLDSAVPGEWDLTLQELPAGTDEEGAALFSFKARLQILGVIRECVGSGRDYKSAATDAFKRAAVRFGIGHELYDLENNWVQMDGDGRYAKPITDPASAYRQRYGALPGEEKAAAQQANAQVAERVPARHEPYDEYAGQVPPVIAQEEQRKAEAIERSEQRAASAEETPACPKCGSRMWDNRLSKRNPKAPDFKCRDKSCDGVVWPPRPGEAAAKTVTKPAPSRAARSEKSAHSAGPLVPGLDDFPEPLQDEEDDLPF